MLGLKGRYHFAFILRSHIYFKVINIKGKKKKKGAGSLQTHFLQSFAWDLASTRVVPKIVSQVP